MPRVSVIIPNYNHAAFLRQRIDSVLNQSFTDFELIILDDHSTDNSTAIIDLYRNHEKVTQIIFNTSNSSNTFKQWDKGIKLANGEYIWIAESDDWSEPTFLAEIMKGLDENKNAVVGYSQSYCINGDNKIQFQSNHPYLSEYINGKTFIKRYIIQKNPIFNAGMAVWKKDVYDKISKDFIDYKVIGDYYFWIEICHYGDVFISGKSLNFFRTHNKNVSVSSFKNGLIYTEQITLLKKLLHENIIEREDYLQVLKRNYSWFRFSKNISKENSRTVEKMFKAAASPVKLKLYFYKQYSKTIVKKILTATQYTNV